ncbi:MAG: hypothetical protein JKY37_14905 [Nannocystaceae bacterium]|nr:hypothetical protein [Nannocystaceae bacterium]
MLYRGDSAQVRAAAKRLLELAERREALPQQRKLMASLGASRRIAAVRPLVRSWACCAQIGPPRPRLFSRTAKRSDETIETASAALQALLQLWSVAAPTQYHRLDQELRAGGSWSSVTGGGWWRLSPRPGLDGLPDSGELRTVGLGVLSCHPSGHMRQAALRELARGPLAASLPFLLVRANDWVPQVRAVAATRLAALEDTDIEVLAPLLELVLRLAAQGRREPRAVAHLLSLLRTGRGLATLRDYWGSSSPSLRRAAVRFSWDEAKDRGPVLKAGVESRDPVLRRWAVERLAEVGAASRTERLRMLARDSVPMVAEAALDVLDTCIEPGDRELLKELRCAPSPSVQLTARFMLDKHFGESSHREVYLGLLGTDDERSRIVAAVGLSATGEASDHRVLLSEMSGAGAKGRRRLLGAAASLDYEGTRSAILKALGHGLPGLSKAARRLLAEHVKDADADVLADLLGSEYTHARHNALLLVAQLGHWIALPLILRGTRDADGENVDTAKRLLDRWLARHFHGIYRVPGPSIGQKAKVRAELVACAGRLEQPASANIERALAGEWGS